MNTTIQKMTNTIQNIKIDESSLGIIELTSKYPFELFTVDKIKKLTKTNYATAYRKVDLLVNLGVFSKTMYGMASQIRIDLSKEKTISILSLIEAKKLEMFAKKLKEIVRRSIKEIMNDAENLSEFKCIVIFGSYAKGTQTKESDLDVLVIYEPSTIAVSLLKDRFEYYIKGIKDFIMGVFKTNELRAGVKINPIIVSGEEHREMILDKRINVAKEALSSHIILKGHSAYWQEIAWCTNAK